VAFLVASTGERVATLLHGRAAHVLVEVLWASDLLDDSLLAILDGTPLLQVELASSASDTEGTEGPPSKQLELLP